MMLLEYINANFLYILLFIIIIHLILYERQIKEGLFKNKKKKKGGWFGSATKKIKKSTSKKVFKPIENTVEKKVFKPIEEKVFKPIANFFKDPFDIQKERDQKKEEIAKKIQLFREQLEKDFDERKIKLEDRLKAAIDSRDAKQTEMENQQALLNQAEILLEQERINTELAHSDRQITKQNADIVNTFMYSTI